MTHKIKSVKAMENIVLLVEFQNGIEVGKRKLISQLNLQII